MKLIIVRHGETIENKKGIMQGQMHGTLSDKGKTQAKLAAERLRCEKIDKIYSSDLKRALDTAEEIAAFHKQAELILAPSFREWSRGEYEGKTKEEIPEHLLNVNLRKNVDFSFPGGESIREVYERVKKAFKKIKKEDMDKNVLIVAHGVVIRALFRIIKGIEVDGEFELKEMPNTSVSIFEINKEGNHEVICFNCGEHLEKS